MLLLQVFAVVLRLVIGALFWLVGLLAAWVASTSTEVRLSKHYAGRPVRVFTALWAWPWSNEENGVDGLTGTPPAGWRDKVQGWSLRKIIWRWSALRNPQNNLRYVPVLSPSYDPKQIKSRTWGDGNFFVSQGVYSGLRLHVKAFGKDLRLWIGWKFRPGDENGIPSDDARLPRADFAFQIKKWDD